MNFLSIFIMPLLGAAIGYSTNLLAIAMLFRPHSEKRFFGLRLPFTPGLLPKEQRQLAQKIGETLGANVLTHEALMEGLANSQIVENVVGIVENLAEGFVNNPNNLGELLGRLTGRSEDELKITAANFAEKLFERVTEANLPEKALEFLLGEQFRRQVVDFGANIVEKDQEIAAFLRAAAEKHIHRLAPAIGRLLDDPRVDSRLRGLATKIIKENAGGLLGIFVKPDKIYNNIKENLLEYLRSTECHALILEKLGALQFDRNSVEKWLDTAVSAAQKNISDELKFKILNFAKEQVNKSKPALVEKAVDALLALVPAKIFANLDYRQAVASTARKLVEFLAEKAGQYIVGSMDIAKIAEERIANFDSKEIERLVLSVAGKQLRWIALLGGILGFIIGFLPVFVL